ncbi:chemotaxis protein [Trinickia dabaoshanensis]|uniref:Chemotaxis protein n=1 Tax=Trinickia dabaoshanensis TaxID=564714 RepID=A0A2N7W376_9BURK|nr:methyl-accepting chemotaxis protein [Trinickia dabaoshanensis]PMS23861.1 chemotaxis protein [Trinickia dabaoshanensis]
MKWFYDLKIARRLMVLNLVAALALAAVTGFGIFQMGRVFRAASYASDNTVPSFLALDSALKAYDAMTLLTSKHVAASEPQKMQQVEQQIAEQRNALRKALSSYDSLISDQKDRDMLAADRAAMAQSAQIRDQVLALSRANQKQQAGELLDGSLTDAAQRFDTAIEAHRAYNRELGEQGAQRADALIGSADAWNAISSLVVIVGVFGLGVAAARSITQPLARAVEFAHRVAKGDLTGEIEAATRDEVGQLLSALDEMNANLRNVVVKVRTGSETIATATAQIAAGNLDLSSRTEEQASSLQLTASSMEQLTSTVRQNAENAQQASTLASSASDVAQHGSGVVGQLVDTMTEISERSSKIADITGMIEGIAFQTNILALNAAVEAARAGEQGRGFAVVASEVRSLAQRSSSAAKEIKDLIAASVETVDQGSSLAGEAGSTMTEITRAITRVTDIMGEIAAASDEQRRGIEQVSAAVTQMDSVTQQNAALVEQAAAASQSLDEQGRQLGGAVAFFRASAH